MQPWPDQGQNGADEHDTWPTGFMFPPQAGQFDPNQEQWPDQSSFPQIGHDLSDGPAPDFHFDSVHHAGAEAFLGDQHMSDSQSGQPGFHGAGGHDSMSMDQHQPFSSAGQDMLDPSFSNLHPNLFAPPHQQQHQGKGNLVDTAIGSSGMSQIAMGQGPNHPAVSAQHDYPFTSQAGSHFDPSSSPSQVPQYTLPPLMPRPSPSHQQSHTPVQQQFDGTSNLHTGFSQSQPFSRPSQHQQSHHRHQHQNQQPQSQPQRERARQHHQQYPTADRPFAPSTNGQPNHFGSHSHLAYPQYQENPLHPHLQQASFQQPEFISQKSTSFQPPAQGSGGQISSDEQKQEQQRPKQQPQSASLQGASISNQAQLSLPQQLAAQVDPKNRQPLNADESPARRKKSNLKSVPDVAITEPLAGVATDFLVADSVAKKTEEPLILQAPLPSAAESKLLGESSKRVKAAQSRVPSTKALPFLAYDGTIKLPAPKSYDKLVPLVAVPSRSGKPVVPMLGYDLPCEIQGKFTSQYKPSFDKSGLDDRREEAKIILGEYERSMQALGKRQPKYTEYPHAFKEQLKADEASKNKAEKKAKKELEEERNKPIRAATRPADPAAAAAWDITGIVHIEQSVVRTNALIAGRVQQAGEFLINLRGEVNRAKVALDQATKDKKSDAEITRLRQDADHKKEKLYQALDATVEHSDDAVLDNLGGHQRLVLSLVNTLIYCIKAGDFSGKLPKIVLELFTHLCMTKKTAETSNFDTVRRRLEDKGDSEVKGFVRDIAVKIKKLTKTSETDTATGYTGTSAASRAKAGSRSSTAADALSAKRGRDNDSDAIRNVKKIAIEPGSSLLSKKLGQPKSQPQVGSRLTAVTAAKPVTSILPGKPRPVAKPASKSQEAPLAADSPNVSADEKSKADVKRPLAKVETRTATVKSETKGVVAPSATSSISSLLESINAKKPEPSVVALAAGSKEGRQSETPETSEQAAKRLRKEARRKLRVSWKPDGELVQIKVFEKSDEEDEGRDMNMIRDAADDRSEGMVLKRRASVAMEDDDEDVLCRPWLAPAATELSSLPDDVRAKNYVTRGGHIVVSTEEQKFMAEREKRELVVLYTDPADIPPTPKSPLAEAEVVGTAAAEQKLGRLPDDEPALKEVHSRWRDEEQMGLEQASLAATKRCQAKSQASMRVDSILGRLYHQVGSGARPNAGRPLPSSSSSPGNSPAASSMSKNINVPLLLGPTVEEYVLGWLRWDKMNLWRDTNPVGVEPARVHRYTNSEVQAASRMLEAVVASLTNKPYPASSPPDWLAGDGDRGVEWWLGYNKEVAAKQKKKEEEDARAEMVANALRMAGQGSGSTQDWGAYYAAQQQQQQQQQQAYRPYMALLQHMTGLQQQPQQLAPQAPVGGLAQGQQPQMLDYQLQSILAAINQPTQQHTFAMPAPSQGPYDGSAQTSSQAGQSQRADGEWEGNENQHKGERKDGRKKSSLPPHKPSNKAQAGTKSCTCRQQGKCMRGDKCALKHK